MPPDERDSARARAALLFGAAAAAGVGLGWGFTVDDALVSARVARHLALGLGHRFNPAGPSVDCVTPLGFAHLLAPLAGGSTWQTLTHSSLVGAAAWVLAAAQLGRLCAQRCQGWRLWLLAAALASHLPLGAWAASGMETPFVMALGVLALTPGALGDGAAGLAAAWRPELGPWALVLACGRAIARRAPPAGWAGALGLALGPPLAMALVRELAFGDPAPLAVYAKPSDLEHGLRYAFGAVLLSGPPLLLVARRSWRALPRHEQALAAALAAHAFVLVGVGGDWMPFWRLSLPALPGVWLLGATLLGATGAAASLARGLAVLACAGLLQVARGPAAREVRAERARLVAGLPPLLAGARRVATLDVGWVGAAGEHEVVDLAGVTDPEVAYLPGGHTSKRLPVDFLERREVEALVVLAEETGDGPPRPARQVEQRLMTLRGAARFELAGSLALDARQRYLVLRRRDPAEGAPP